MFSNNILNNLLELLRCLTRSQMTRCELHLTNYTDEVHINKLKEVVPDELQNTLIIYEITNQTLENWNDYIKLLISAYKALYPDKTQGLIFGSNSNCQSCER